MYLITVRDGRIGRDPSLVTDEGGEVLSVFEREAPHDEGDLVLLPDGTQWPVIGLRESMSAAGFSQTVFIGDSLT